LKIAILGGTFNPIHNGHIMLAKNFADKLNIEKVLVIPTSSPPHKDANNLISNKHRQEMCKIAAKKDKRFIVSDIEIKRGGKSYTVETLETLINAEMQTVLQASQMQNAERSTKSSEFRIPNSELYFICGSDMFLTLEHWYRAEDIFKMCTIAAAARGNENFEMMSEYAAKISEMGAKVVLEKFDIPDISSTEIRNRVKNGQDIKNLVCADVAEYINVNNLYRD